MAARTTSRVAIALFYATAGSLHLFVPEPFVSIVPSWVPEPALTVLFTGLAEIAGAAGMVQPWSGTLRILAGWGLAAYALCVWPANVQHMLLDIARPDHGLGLVYHVPRLALQPALMWWPLWSVGVISWPFRNC
ncbi:DoxX family protein [Novosphingobium sp. 9]|uniref:DoxX family protein n=1 Tax=Novosphingobium sp. 9 TaxID=2025349 RepID=UPI0021B62D76|nr:DoxX family protein [Novosphingobium sp. 9]